MFNENFAHLTSGVSSSNRSSTVSHCRVINWVLLVTKYLPTVILPSRCLNIKMHRFCQYFWNVNPQLQSCTGIHKNEKALAPGTPCRPQEPRADPRSCRSICFLAQWHKRWREPGFSFDNISSFHRLFWFLCRHLVAVISVLLVPAKWLVKKFSPVNWLARNAVAEMTYNVLSHVKPYCSYTYLPKTKKKLHESKHVLYQQWPLLVLVIS